MITIISPAKSLNFEILPGFDIKYSVPDFEKESYYIASKCKNLSSNDLQKLMSISKKIADLNIDRFNKFSSNHNSDNSRPAIFAYDGDVYKNIDKISFNHEDLLFANSHVRIISGLYGILKPLDLIQQYRLEMSIKLKLDNFEDLYSYWSKKVTTKLNEDLSKDASKTLINLASNEYFFSIDRKIFSHKIISVSFLNKRDDTYKNIGILSKKARGMMLDFIIKNKINHPEKIKEFSKNGYKFSEENSTENLYIFHSIG